MSDIVEDVNAKLEVIMLELGKVSSLYVDSWQFMHSSLITLSGDVIPASLALNTGDYQEDLANGFLQGSVQIFSEVQKFTIQAAEKSSQM